MATHRLPLWLLLVFLPGCSGCDGDAGFAAVSLKDVNDSTKVDDAGNETGGDPDDDIALDGDEDTVDQDTTFTAESVPAADVDGDARDFGDDAAAAIFILSADGEVPGSITVSVRIGESAPPGIDFNLCAVIVEHADDSADIAEGLVINADEETGETWVSFVVFGPDVFTPGHDGAHFLVVLTDVRLSVDTTPDAGEVGDLFTTTCIWEPNPTDGLAGITGSAVVSLSSPEYEADQDEYPVDLTDCSGAPCTLEIDAVCTANAVGSAIAIRATDITLVDFDAVFGLAGSLDIHVDTLATCTGPGPVTLDDIPGIDQEDPIDVEIFGGEDTSNGLFMVIAYQDGVVVVDLEEAAVELDLDYVHDNAIGGVAISTGTQLQATQVDAVISYGNDGYGITHYDPVFGEFGATEIDPSSGSVSDADNYEEDPSRAVLVQSGRNQVRFVELATDPFSGSRFRTVDTLVKNIPAGLFPGATGYVTTATRRNDTGPVYFVTVGATPTDPGQLWRKNDPAALLTPATLVGSVGNAPRRIRFEGPVGVVSNNGSNTLTILTRDASDNVAIKGTVNVGDGPIGVDLIALPNGNIGVLSTGYRDNTYTVTIVEPDGDVVSNETSPVPTGGLNPSSAVWANAEGTRIAVSCHGSDKLVIFSIG